MGLADVLGLSKTASFVATVHVLELLEVPLVSAHFRLKWKFKHARDSAPGQDDGQEEGAARRFLHPLNAFHGTLARPSAHARQDSDDSGVYSPQDCLSPPMSPLTDPRTPNPDRTPTAFQQPFASPFGSPINSPSSLSYEGGRPFDGAEDTPRRTRSHGISPDGPLLLLTPPRAEAKGTTALITLRNYTATFQREVHCTVAIPLRPSPSSSKYQLQPSPLKLSLRQEHTDENGKKAELKTGEVLLDLSQFVGQKGKDGKGVTRRYLLKDCKTNATLRVTVRMEWVGGESAYLAPPLMSGQVQETRPSTQALSTSASRPSLARARKSSSTSVSSLKGPRSDSSSSISVQSSPSTQSLDSPQSKRQGWRPPSASTAQALPGGLFGASLSTEHSANDIIDSIFNRPEGRSLWGFTHTANSGGRHRAFTVGQQPTSYSSGIALSTTRRHSQALIPPSKPNSRPTSPASDTSAYKSRSVRWGDDGPPLPSPPPVTTRHSATLRPSSSSHSLRGLEQVGEEDERSRDSGIETTPPPVELKLGETPSSRTPVQITLAPSPPFKQRVPAPPLKKRSDSAPEQTTIDWAQSWT